MPLWRRDHVSIEQLVEDFARCLHLPRLQTPAVLMAAIHGCGLLVSPQDSLYADCYDEEAGRYRGVRGGKQIALPDSDSSGLLVKPDLARKQLEAVTHFAGPTPPRPGRTQPGLTTSGADPAAAEAGS